MVSLALLGTTIKDQLTANPEGLSGVDVAWSGTSLSRLLTEGPSLDLDVVVVDIEMLGENPEVAAAGLQEAIQPEILLVVYSFAKRNLVGSLNRSATRALQSPVSLEALRAQMLGVIVRQMLSTSDTEVPCPRCGSVVPESRLKAS